MIGVPDARWGEGVHAVVMLKAGANTTADELRRHAKSLIGGSKVPHRFEFVAALTVSAAGKVLKRELRARNGSERELVGSSATTR